ncbi:Nrm1-like protein [Ophiostoma piceae UAMH 11346]|uniref:Nrm1-like protein n=1 Tax=Ophiostoma piceae (strain UAMH 11346) TaxID=1262450 RepID=S3CDC6_OPHP1|nr:Nrm1-like protein [Ophiostoma piceae UAMH 11346]
MDRDAHVIRNTQIVRDVLPRLSDRSDAAGAPLSASAAPSPSRSSTALDIFANAEKLPAHPLQKLLNQDSHAQQPALPSSQISPASQQSHHPYYSNSNRTSNGGDSQDTNSSADTTVSTDTDHLFTPSLSEAELSTSGGGSGSVNGSTTANGYNCDNDSSSQESQLHQLSRLAATQQRMNDARILDAIDGGAASRKRAADGSVKHARNASSTSPVFGTGFGNGHSRNTSTVSVASTAGGRIGELSAELKTRLSYAMVKVNNGWQSHSLDQVENLSQHVTSPSSTASTINGHGRHGVSVSPRIPGTRPTHRRHQSYASQSTVEQTSRSAQSTPSLPSPLAPPRNGFSAQSSSQPTRSLAPPASIQPSRPSALSRRNSNPAYAPPPLAHSYSQGASPHTPAFDQNSHRMPSSNDQIMFSPHQNVREQDAIETLLFMSSPGNSSNMKHFPSITSSSQPLPSGHHDPQQHLQSPLSITTTASPQRHALPNGPRKSLPSGRPHAQTFSGSQLYTAVGRGRGHNRNVSDMDIDEPYISPYSRSNKGTPKRRANGADGPTPRIKMPLPMSSGLSVSAKPRPVLDEEDIEKMLDRAAAASADDSSDSESEILIPSRRVNQMGV